MVVPLKLIAEKLEPDIPRKSSIIIIIKFPFVLINLQDTVKYSKITTYYLEFLPLLIYDSEID